jgi:dihydrofolate reductase
MLFSFITTSLDGYYEGPNQEFDWPVVDEEFLAFSVEQLDTIDTLLFGRITYEGMAEYWTSPEAAQDSPEIAHRMNAVDKLVASRTLTRADWAPSRVLSGNVAGELNRLKQDRTIAIFGSSNLTTSLFPSGVVDELRIMVNPVALGGGMSMLHSATERIPLRLLRVRPFESGNVLLTYAPAPA